MIILRVLKENQTSDGGIMAQRFERKGRERVKKAGDGKGKGQPLAAHRQHAFSVGVCVYRSPSILEDFHGVSSVIV